MFKLFIIIGLAIAPVLATAAHTSRIDIDSASSRRVVCDVSFAKIDGLKVIATPVPESRWKSRVDIERYTACPYDVRMTYEGQTLRIDFSRSVTQQMVDAYEPGMDVNTGFYHLESDGWITNDELAPNPANKISVEASEHETLITGIAHPLPDKGQPAYVCFSVALIMQGGMATGTVCSSKAEVPLIFSKLFAKARVIKAN